MALTRPKLGQINTNVTVLTDAITVLSAGANQANVDVGFLINRAHGLVPNAAFYYSETLDTFVTAFTNNTGGTDSNILVTNYADFTAGNVYTTGLYWTGNGLPINFATGGSGSGNITVRSLFSGNLQPNVTVANITAIEFDEESGFDIQNRGSGNVLVAMNSTFKYWEVTGSEQLVAVGLDHITINSGNNIVITSNANATPYKSITFSVNSNPVFNNVSAAGYFWANGTPFVSSNYGNTDVAAYLDSYFIYANANAASQTTAFTTLDANVGSYQLWANTSITNLQSNAAFQANLIDVLTGNAASQGSLLDVLVANAVEQSANLTSLLSNAAAQEASLTSLVNNAASQSGAIDSINANIGAYQTYANANAATQTTEIVDLRANIEAANAAIITANTGMKSYVDDQIVSAGGYGNTQVEAYLPIYSGNLNPGNITATGTIVGGGVRNTSGSTPPANPTVGDTWYDTDNDTLLRYINDGDSNQWVDLSGIIVGETPTAFGNVEVAAYMTEYLPLYEGDVLVNGIYASAFYWANATPFESSVYSNSNVASYLPVDSTIIGINGNLITANTEMESYVNAQDSILSSRINAANAAIVTANSAVVSYVNTLNTAMAANVTGANTAIVTANTSMKSYVDAQVISASGYSNVALAGYLQNIRSTSSATPPGSPVIGDIWFSTTENLIYRYTSDGTTNAWLDITGAPHTFDVTNNLAVSGSIIPTANVAYDLGNSAYRFRDLYLSGNTIYLGGTTLSANTITSSASDARYKATMMAMVFGA